MAVIILSEMTVSGKLVEGLITNVEVKACKLVLRK